MVLEDARRHAIDRMIENAKLLGANAVIAMRFDSWEIGKARAEGGPPRRVWRPLCLRTAC